MLFRAWWTYLTSDRWAVGPAGLLNGRTGELVGVDWYLHIDALKFAVAVLSRAPGHPCGYS